MKKMRFPLITILLSFGLFGQLAAATPLNDNTFDEAITRGVSIVDFHADWCGACQKLKPVFSKVEREMDGVFFATVDVDDGAATLKYRYQIRALPTLILFKNGNEVGRHTGYADAATLRAFIKNAL